MEEKNNEIKSPFELFGVECGKGWEKLLEPVFNYIIEYNKTHQDEKIEVLQVKEKFGTLRFYTNFHTQRLGELISKAEEESRITCERCGSKKEIGSTCGWLMTVCKPCIKEIAMNNKYTREYKWRSYDDNNLYLVTKDGNFELIEK